MSLKPLSTSVNAAMLHRMILHWKQAEVTPVQINKMLLLYLGEIPWMDNTGKYPAVNFYEISRCLKFKSTELFLKCLAKCKGFGIIFNNKGQGIKDIGAFYSPLWHSTNDGIYYEVTNGDLHFSKNVDKKPQLHTGSASMINNNIYNNPKSTPTAAAELEEKNLLQTKENKDCNEEAIKEFIKKLYLDSTACQTIIKPINEYTEQKIPSLKCSSDDASTSFPGANQDAIKANPATKRFLEHYLLKHLCQNIKKFAIKTFDGRIYWISNLIKYDFMHQMMDRAVSDFIKQHGGSERAMQQQNRPLSPYEYQDPLTHQRLYDFTNQAGKQCQARIPANAAPRPSDTVYWNKFSKTWMEWRN